MRFHRPRAKTLGLAVAVLLTSGCSRAPEPPSGGWNPTPTRGYILISLDSLAARHLGAYGYRRDTSPFFDRLARRGQLFELAIAQSPSTLVSHLSLMTGLYPSQHGVDSPRRTRADEIETLAQRFSRHGFVTAGHTEGGFVGRDYGFHHGFDEFSDTFGAADTEIENTLERGLEFLRRLGPEDRFFLLLHSYSLHPPYDPPEPYRASFLPGPGDSSKALEESAGQIPWRAFNAGFADVDDREVEIAASLYDAGIRYVDHRLEEFFDELESLGLVEETTVVITSDHGQEFLEHGRLGHSQVYPESVHVPLLFLHPNAAPARIPALVELVDVAPTLYELAGLRGPAPVAGESLASLVGGGRAPASWAYSEARGATSQRALFSREGATVHQVVTTTLAGERDGVWVTRSAGFEASAAEPEVSIVAFYRPREIRVTLEGAALETLEAGTGWSRLPLSLPPGRSRYRLDLATDGCDSPLLLDLGNDPRCLSFKLRGLEPELDELFRLDLDPGATRDLGSADPELLGRLTQELARLRWATVAPPRMRPLTDEIREPLRALGAID